jgi:hypothetical protein
MPASSNQPPSQSGEPSLHFYYSSSLHVRLLAVLEDVEQAKDSTQHRGALSDVVIELASIGMDYYYLRPLRLAKSSPVLARSARMGINAVLWIMSPVIRKVIGGMDQPQLLAVCTHIRQLMG